MIMRPETKTEIKAPRLKRLFRPLRRKQNKSHALTPETKAEITKAMFLALYEIGGHHERG